MADWAPLRNVLDDVTTFVTYAWSDLDELVGGLPRSAYEYSAYWKGTRGGWPGFTTVDVRVGESVTFVRIVDLPPATPARRVSPPQEGALPSRISGDNRPDLVLVGCVKSKLSVSAPAKDLYISALFRKERAYAEHLGVPWFILSAEHGLVDPDTVLEPYDRQLSKTSRDYRLAWGRRVIVDLNRVAGDLQGRTIEIHAGAAYADAIRDGLRAAGADVVEPLAGLPMGSRLAWYGKANSFAEETNDSDVPMLVKQLTDHDHAISPANFLDSGGAGFRSPGLYSWWTDDAGAAELSAGLGHNVAEGLLYVGLAGATRSGGETSQNTLWGRIQSMHLGNNHGFSTFRRSLGSILAAANELSEIDEATLTAWMLKHLRLIAIPVADADTLGAVETRVLAELNPPLNLAKVDRDPLRQRLSELRSQFGQKKPGI